MKLDFFTYDIAEQWIVPIEYGDYSGLHEDEIELLEAFLDSLPRDAMGWQWSDEIRFARDEVSGLSAQCLEGKLYISEVRQ